VLSIDKCIFLHNVALHGDRTRIAALKDSIVNRALVVVGIALVAVFLGAHSAFAQAPEFCLCGICFGGGDHGWRGGGGGPHSAPAPLLAAGIPAFTALGGGILVARVRKRMQRRG